MTSVWKSVVRPKNGNYSQKGHGENDCCRQSLSSSPSLSLEEDVGVSFTDFTSCEETTKSGRADFPLKMMLLDRPSHDLEMAVAVRGRTRTHETQRTDSDATSSSEEDSQHDHFDDDAEEESPIETTIAAPYFNGAKMSAENASEMARLFQLEPIPQRDEQTWNPLVTVPVPASTTSSSPSSSSSSPPAVVMDPVPQRRPPSLCPTPILPTSVAPEASSNTVISVSSPPLVEETPFLQLDLGWEAVSSPPLVEETPLPPARPRVGSIGGAFTRYLPKIEGASREVMDVNPSTLSITWGTQQDKPSPPVNHQNSAAVNERLRIYDDKAIANLGQDDDDDDDVSSVDTASLIQSQPQMSAIAAASSAWQHHKKTGSVRSGSETGGDETYYDDDISLTTSAQSSLTGTDILRLERRRRRGRCCCFRRHRSHSKSKNELEDEDGQNPHHSLCCVSRMMPSCLRYAPPHVQVMLFATAVLLTMAVVVFALTSIFVHFDNKQASTTHHISSSNSNTGSRPMVIADAPEYHKTWEEWNAQKNSENTGDDGHTRHPLLRKRQ
eukprot:CAMPEP_0172473638 /NCGR_PEP_ID=MMETSP1065-20121228/68956_1 /TAXON_ID=265537 /ORGANISM="Amphiprora paludosa, Strain CCMP125" /LENGTH=553 /DNA_ID=CAMNT_0013231813 /DNA_START=105 /DNA_END=1767 /DNA_ORIENTATION=-